MSNGRSGGFGAGARRGRRRKACSFCVDKIVHIDYKDGSRLRRYLTDRGKILPRRVTGTCAKHQRGLANAILRARRLALLPYITMELGEAGERPERGERGGRFDRGDRGERGDRFDRGDRGERPERAGESRPPETRPTADRVVK